MNVLRRRKIIKIFFALLCCCCLSRKSFSLKKWLLLKRIYWEKLLLTFLSGGCVQRIKIVPKIIAHKCSYFFVYVTGALKCSDSCSFDIYRFSFFAIKKNQTLEEVGYVKEHPFNNEAQNYYLQLWLISHKKQH